MGQQWIVIGSCVRSGRRSRFPRSLRRLLLPCHRGADRCQRIEFEAGRGEGHTTQEGSCAASWESVSWDRF
jgi:hypothetical protein